MSLAGYAAINGTVATFRTVALGAYTPSTGVQAETPTDTTIRGILESYELDELTEQINVDDRKYTVSAGSFSAVPTTEDRVVIGGVTYEIVRVFRFEKRGAADHYILQLRRL